MGYVEGFEEEGEERERVKEAVPDVGVREEL